MSTPESHGRLKTLRQAILGIAVPSVLALGVGAYLGMQSDRVDRKTIELEKIQNLSQLERGMIDATSAALEAFQAQILALRQVRRVEQGSGLPSDRLSRPEKSLLHYAEFQLDTQGVPILRSAASQEGLNRRATSSFEEVYLGNVRRFLAEQARAATPQPGKRLLLMVQPDPQQPREWIALITIGEAREVVVGVADPSELFASAARFAAAEAGQGTLRAYVLGPRGEVLAHSIPGLAGADFSTSGLFKYGIRGIQRQNEAVGGGRFYGFDQVSVHAAYGRLPDLPLVAVIERVIDERASWWSAATASGLLQQLAGSGLAGLGMIALLVAFFAWRIARTFDRELGARENAGISSTLEPWEEAIGAVAQPQLKPQAQTPAEAIAATPQAPVAAPAQVPSSAAPMRPQPSAQTQINAITNPFIAATTASHHAAPVVAAPSGPLQHAVETLAHPRKVQERQAQDLASYELQRALEAHSMIDRFEVETARMKNPREVAEKFTATASVLCQSPTLFFTYFEGNFSAVLQADAGLDPGVVLPRLTFPIDSRVLSAVAKPERPDEPLSLANYGPLAHLVLSRFGTAYFEAWAVTGYGPLGRAAQRPRLLGVLVILRAGTVSASRRDLVARMIRGTGLVYENAVLSL